MNSPLLSLSVNELPVLDPEAIDNLRALGAEGDDSFLKEIIAIFIDDTPIRLAELRQAFDAGDLPSFTRAAHSIKGSASNLGAARLRGLAEKLEHSSRQSGLDGLEPGIPAMQAEFAVAKAELEKL